MLATSQGKNKGISKIFSFTEGGRAMTMERERLIPNVGMQHLKVAPGPFPQLENISDMGLHSMAMMGP